MTPTHIGQVLMYSLRAQDVPATVHFYQAIVGLGLLPDHGRHPAFDLGNGSHLVIVQGPPPRPAPHSEPRSWPQIAFAVEDLDAAIAHLEVCGVEMPWGVEETREARWIVFADPGGNLIEFAQLKGERWR